MSFGLYKRGKIWYYDFYIGKKRYRGSTSTSSKELSLSYAKKLYTDLFQCKHHLNDNQARLRISDFIDEHLRLLKSNVSDDWHNTIKYLLFQFEHYIKGNVSYLDEIDLHLLEDYRNHRLSVTKKSTTKNAMVVIGAMLNRAVKYGYLPKNPARNLEPLCGIQINKQRFLSNDEIQKVLEITKNTYLENLVLTVLYTGMRRREAIHLEYQDIDLEKKLIYVRNKNNFVTKSRRERVVPLHSKLFNVFQDCEQKKGVCFLYNRDRIIHEDTASRNFKELMFKIGLADVGLHTIRHTFASHALMSGISIWEVAKWLGHSTTYVTELYGHLCPERREIDRLNI